MALHLYRYGEAHASPGLCIGVARHPPRGIKREDYTAKGYFDLWLPQLAPSRDLVASFRSQSITFKQFAQRYRKQMHTPANMHLIELLAHVSLKQPISLGCFCADAAHCHRSVLYHLIADKILTLQSPQKKGTSFASPACSMPEIEDDPSE